MKRDAIKDYSFSSGGLFVVGVNITTLVLKNIQIDDHATGHVESFCHYSLLDYKCIKG